MYYWFSDPSITTEITLEHILEDPFGGSYGYQYFNGTIPSGNIQNNETRVLFRVNVSDIVDGARGREGRSSTQTVWVDSLNPRVTGITIDGGVSVPGKNVTSVDVPVILTVDLYDWSSISSVAIYYSMPNGTFPIKLIMQNTSYLSSTTETFNVTLPATNETAFVEYFFETEDFLGNKGNTSLINFYYSDASGPVLETYSTYPTIISNYTNVYVLFNSSDYSGSMQPVLWYSFDNQISWEFIGADPIDYQADMVSETFKATDLHYIKDNTVNYFTLEVIRSIPVDEATLTFDITHELPTDLRIWLKLDDGRKFMLFDREPGLNTFTRNIDLIGLGITENDFTKGNFTLEIQDFSESYSGSIIKYEIEIFDYKFPLGYKFYAQIPASENDTTVFFYLNMTDSLWNSEVSSIFSYYSDGLAPEVSVVQHVSPLNLSGAQTIRIYANILDAGGISSADAYYRFSENTDWSISPMTLNTTSGLYYFDVSIYTRNGTLSYKIRAFDLSGLSSETSIYTIIYSDGLGPFIEVQGLPYPSPLDMEDKNTIRIWANVTDYDGNVTACTISYRFVDTDEWKFKDMVFDEETGFYYFDVKVNKRSGNMTFIISATDNLGLTWETDPYTIEYENAGTTPELPTELLLFGAILALGGGGSVAAVGYLYKKGKLKLPERFTRGDTGTD